MNSQSLSLLWLRRDLRLHDHAALHHALTLPGRVQPVFVLDTEILAAFPNPKDRRLSFIMQALTELDAELQKRGGGVLLLHGQAREVMPRLAAALGAHSVVASRDYEPATQARDAEVAAHIELHLVKDHLIFAPDEVLKADGSPFKVFTPYSRAWLAKFSPSDMGEYPVVDAGRYADTQALARLAKAAGLCVLEPAQALQQVGYQPVPLPLWPVAQARARLSAFIEQKSAAYPHARDLVAEQGTSQISPYLRFGLVSIREALRQATATGGADKWISELIWREFYAMILYHYPESTTQEWSPQWRGLAWSRDAAHLAAWKEGKTGYPLVDAAMRQLLQTGWMHNRARMVVASFLTKDLQIDWRLGEAHFAQELMDYELASNVGGWQWAASTGTDAQPWFRIFNPTLQSEKFDPQGNYIRTYVPELRQVRGAAIHEPAKLGMFSGYTPPIVNHARAREKTLQMFKAGKAE